MEARSSEMSLVIVLHQFTIFAQPFEVRYSCSKYLTIPIEAHNSCVHERIIISIVDVRYC